MSSESEPHHALKKVRAKRHVESSRSIHPYFGKVDPGLSLEAIRRFSEPGQTVLDPFCGSGTVLHDALVSGRSSEGWDSSPLAALIATCKVLGVTERETSEIIAFVEQVAGTPSLFSANSADQLAADPQSVPAMPRVRSIHDWFTRNAIRELAELKQAIAEAQQWLSPEAHVLLRLTFSRIIIAASNQQGESTYRRIEKPDDVGRVKALFKKAAFATVKAAKAFNGELALQGKVPVKGRLKIGKDQYQVRYEDLAVKILVRDSRLERRRAEAHSLPRLVVTSPPYLMSWDYGLYHKFRFYWLGFDLDTYEETEIGRHLRRQDDDVPRYQADMGATFATLKSATHASSTMVMVNAPSVVYGVEVDTNSMLAELAAAAEWKLVWSGDTLGIPGPHHGMYGSLEVRNATAPGAAGKREHVLVFTK